MDIQVRTKAPDLLKAKPDENSLGFGQHMADHMFVMLYDEKIGWHDAVIKPYENFSLDPASMVLHYGQEIFEGLKAYRGHEENISFPPHRQPEKNECVSRQDVHA
jgi:branched-chain amino acid aminotransferase